MQAIADMTFKVADEAEIAVARNLNQTLAHWAARVSSVPTLEATISLNGQQAVIPLPTLLLLAKAVDLMAGGHAVDVAPIDQELSAQEAADLLKVSRPYLMNLLNKGDLPFRKVGTHHRLSPAAVIAYKRTQTSQRREALEALTAETQAPEG